MYETYEMFWYRFFCFLHNFIHRNKLKIVENHCKVWSPGNQEFEVGFPLPTSSGHKGLQSFKRAAQGTRNSWNRRKLESYMIIHNHTISYYITLYAYILETDISRCHQKTILLVRLYITSHEECYAGTPMSLPWSCTHLLRHIQKRKWL